jgi:acetyl esterase/lipase
VRVVGMAVRFTLPLVGSVLVSLALAMSLVWKAAATENSILAGMLCILVSLICVLLAGAYFSVSKWSNRTPQAAGVTGWAFQSTMSACIFAWMFFRLVLFATLLLPAFLRVGWWYFRSKNITRSIRYGEKLRQNLDMYVPPNLHGKETAKEKQGKSLPGSGGLPVLIFVGGGAWIVGHKGFCALLGKIFMAQGIIVVAPDYRQFPQVRADDMLGDIDTAIQWTWDNIQRYGGNRDQIFIAGQSAGAHLTSTLILEHARTEYKEGGNAKQRALKRDVPGSTQSSFKPSLALDAIDEREEIECSPVAVNKEVNEHIEEKKERSFKLNKIHAKNLVCRPWKLSRVAGYVGISGPYHLPQLRQHLFDRGIEQLSFLRHIVAGEDASDFTDQEHDEAFSGMSPALRLRRGTFVGMNRSFISNVFPPMLLIHGDSDNVVPKQSTREFARSLRTAGVPSVTVKYLAGASHTDPIIEDLLFDESSGTEAGAISELLSMIHCQKRLDAAAAAAAISRARAKGHGAPNGTKRRRTPSMLADGFGFVTEERGRVAASCFPRLLIKAARFVNPF